MGACAAAFAVAAFLGVVATARADQPAKQTVCPGALGPTVVTGDLVVLSGTSCTLAGTTVLGDVLVQPAATLDAADAHIRGDVSCAGDSCSLTRSTVGSDATLTAGAGLLNLTASKVEDVECYGETCNLYAEMPQPDVFVGNTVTRHVRVGEDAFLAVQRSQIGGNVSCTRCGGLDISDSSIGGNLDANSPTYGANVCEDTIAGHLQVSLTDAGFQTGCDVTHVGGDVQFVQVGGGDVVLALFNFDVRGSIQIMQVSGSVGLGDNVIGRNLQLVNVSGLVELYGNHAGGMIQCTHVSPPPQGAGNTAKRIDPSCGPIGVAG